MSSDKPTHHGEYGVPCDSVSSRIGRWTHRCQLRLLSGPQRHRSKVSIGTVFISSHTTRQAQMRGSPAKKPAGHNLAVRFPFRVPFHFRSPPYPPHLDLISHSFPTKPTYDGHNLSTSNTQWAAYQTTASWSLSSSRQASRFSSGYQSPDSSPAIAPAIPAHSENLHSSKPPT